MPSYQVLVVIYYDYPLCLKLKTKRKKNYPIYSEKRTLKSLTYTFINNIVLQEY